MCGTVFELHGLVVPPVSVIDCATLLPICTGDSIDCSGLFAHKGADAPAQLHGARK